MARLILMILFLAVLALALTAVWSFLRGINSAASRSTQEVTLPDTFKTAAYVLLIVLMFGVVTGWLTGL